jgi:methylmalonyl-CoA/ethylmalonyl-CoA epimerase
LGHIIEFLTVNVAVESLQQSIEQYRSLGLDHIEPVEFPAPPIQMTDVTFQVPEGAAFSLIEPWEGGGPVGRFIDRRGPGVYSIAVRVEDLNAAMRDWSAEGFEWVAPEPVQVPGGRAARYVADDVTVNWVKPKSLGGVLLEVFEIRGNVREF